MDLHVASRPIIIFHTKKICCAVHAHIVYTCIYSYFMCYSASVCLCRDVIQRIYLSSIMSCMSRHTRRAHSPRREIPFPMTRSMRRAPS